MPHLPKTMISRPTRALCLALLSMASMPSILLLLLLLLIPPTAWAEISFQLDRSDSSFWFGTGTISLHLDRDMRLEAFWCEPGGSLSVTASLESADSRPAHYLTVGFTEVYDFRVDDLGGDVSLDFLSSPFLGTGAALTLRGRSEAPALEKTLTIELYDDHPDAALASTSYRNLESETLHITRWWENRLILDLSRASPGWPPYGFLTVQPTSDEWGEDWLGVPLGPGFRRTNRLMGGDVLGRGGMPFLDLWGPALGLAIMSLEPVPRALYFPCHVRTDGRVEVAVEVKPFLSYGQFTAALAPGDSLTGPRTALVLHGGDFYDAAHRYGRLFEAILAESGREAMGPYPEGAYHSYWKTWGHGPGFTVEDVYSHLDELADLGFKRVCLDDGWFDLYGKWDPDLTKFPGGIPDLRTLIDDLHTPRWGAAGDSFEVMLWWNVTGWQMGCGLGPELLIMDEVGGYPVDDRGHCYLCPADPAAVEAVLTMVDKFLGSWGVDGLYMDGIGLLNVPPCFNDAHHHAYPAEAPERLPELYREIQSRARALTADGTLILCECSAPHDPYKMPYYDHEDASDPITDRQMRWKVKFIKAFRGPWAPAGDGYLDPGLNQLSGTFAHTVGTGAVLTSFYSSLESLGVENWEAWTGIYQAEATSRAEYLNLYDVGFEFPEGHALRRNDGAYFFSFMNEEAWSGEVELRGLPAGEHYDVHELDTGAFVAEVTGPAAGVEVTLRRQAPEKPYWIILRATPRGTGGIGPEGPQSGPGEGPAAPGLWVWPVPSRGDVTISFRLPSVQLYAGDGHPFGPPRLAVYDVKGRLVRELDTPLGWERGRAAGGRGGLHWNGLDRSGRPVASGVYLVRLEWGDEMLVRRILITR